MKDSTKIKTVFIGTPDFGLPVFKALLKNKNFEILGVITQPDRPAGRNMQLSQSAIKQSAIKNNVAVHQPKNIKNFKIPYLKIDLIIVIAYAQLIPPEILSLPKYGCLNLHGSLLPKYRGASCVQATILNGDKYAGLSLIKMNSKLDAGDIIDQISIPVGKTETYGTLYEKLSNISADFSIQAIQKYINNNLLANKQNDIDASYLGKLDKKFSLINWENKTLYNEKLIRATNPWPGAWTKWQNKILKIAQTKAVVKTNKKTPGEVFSLDGQMAISCQDGYLIIGKLQLEGKKEMSAEEFIKGHNSIIGTKLGEY